MDVVQVILLTLVIQAAAEYNISAMTSNWTEAVGKCNLAIPNLHPSHEGYEVEIDYEPTEGGMWLGYFMKMTMFDYIGCVKLTHQTFSELGERNTPGLCYTFCRGNKLIGVSIGKCICVNTLRNYQRREVNCSSNCGSTEGGGVACGAHGYMSVYKVKRNDITSDRQNTCLSFQQYDQNKYFNWTKCSKFFRVACNGTSIEESHPWLISMNECFTMGYLPKSFRDLKDIKTNESPFWSGVISSDVIYNYTEWNGNSKGVRFGYMIGNKRVYFTDTDEPKLALCTGSDAESGYSTTVTVTNTKGQTVGIIIGVSVCACVVIIAVVAFILLKRRGKVPNLCTFTKTCCTEPGVVMKDKDNKPSTMLTDSPPNTVNSKQECKSHTNNAYFVLEPSNSGHNVHDINSRERNEPIDTANIYNEIDPEPDSNTTYAYVDKEKSNSIEDDYDTTETTAKTLKRKADNINGDYAELGNDAYSHIGKSPASVGTDQTYNIPHSDDSYSKTDEEHDENDSYSHLNNI